MSETRDNEEAASLEPTMDAKWPNSANVGDLGQRELLARATAASNALTFVHRLEADIADGRSVEYLSMQLRWQRQSLESAIAASAPYVIGICPERASRPSVAAKETK